jgi:hypothetical protein
MDELFSGMVPKKASATAHLEGDGFVDIDEFLSSTKQQNISACAIPNSRGMTEIAGSGIWDGSTASSRSTEGSIQGEHPALLNFGQDFVTHSIPDPIILSDDESMGSESETDYGDFDVEPTAKSDTDSPRVVDRWLADGDSFASRTASTSDRLVADHQDDGNNNHNGIVDSAKLQLAADRPTLASLGHESIVHQASPLRVNTEIIKVCASCVDLDVTKAVEDEDIDVFAKGDDDNNAGTRSTKRSKSSAISCNDPVFDSDVSVSELQDSQHDFAQPSRPGLAVVSPQQSDLTNDPLLRHRRRRDATRNFGCKQPRTPAPAGLASAAPTVSDALESSDLEDPQSVALLAAPGQERELRDIDQEMVDDGGTDDSNDENYDDMSDAAASKIQGQPRSRKRARRMKDTEHNDVETPSTHSLNISYQAITATSSSSMQESEEIPIHGYLTLKTMESKVVYCLTFSQNLSPEPSGTSQRQCIVRSASSSSDGRDSKRLPIQEPAISRHVRNSRFSPKDDELLLQLKGEGLSWDEISEYFPERSKGTLQVHFSTKLKPRLGTSKSIKKRRRLG